MLGGLRAWIDGHRIASFLLITYAFTWSVQAVVVATGMEAFWTMSILIGFGAFGPPVVAAWMAWHLPLLLNANTTPGHGHPPSR